MNKDKQSAAMSKPIVYQVLPRLWGRGKFSSLDDAFVKHMHGLNVTHVWLTGVPLHATGKPFVKGVPGCPYAISDWYDINPYLADNEDARFDEFKQLVKRLHDAGLKVLTDFIPNHVAADHRLVAAAAGHPVVPTCGFHDFDWSDTEKNDYSNPSTERTLTDILRFWAELGVDGFRCDMVELVPPGFFKRAIADLKAVYPGLVFIAEVYEKWRYRDYIENVGFDWLYDKSGLYDSLRGIYRGDSPATAITWNWQFLGDLQANMLNFLENHDEVRAASREFAETAQRSYAALAVSALLNTAPFMIYSGEEYGEDASDSDNCRTSIFDIVRIPALEDGLSGASRCPETACDDAALPSSVYKRFREVMRLAALPAFSEGGIHDLCYCSPLDPAKHFAWARFDTAGNLYVVASNFTGSPASIECFVPDCVIPGGLRLTLDVPPFDFGYSFLHTSRP